MLELDYLSIFENKREEMRLNYYYYMRNKYYVAINILTVHIFGNWRRTIIEVLLWLFISHVNVIKAYIFAFLTSPKCKLLSLLLTLPSWIFLLIIPTFQSLLYNILDDSNFSGLTDRGKRYTGPIIQPLEYGMVIEWNIYISEKKKTFWLTLTKLFKHSAGTLQTVI